MRYLIMMLLLIAFNQVSPNVIAQRGSWATIKVMMSTRDDVTKIMKKKGDGSVFEIYSVKSGTVYISYSFGKCSDDINSGWDIPEDVVIKVGYSFLRDHKFSDLHVNLNGFEKISESPHAPEIITYINREKGVKYVVQADGGLSAIGYFPPARFETFRCQKVSAISAGFQ